MGGHLAQLIGAQRDHHRCARGEVRQGVEVARRLGRVITEKRFLELVDDQDLRIIAGRRAHQVPGPLARGRDRHPMALAAQPGRDPGAHHRRLAAARRADDGQHALLGEHTAAVPNHPLAPEEGLAVIDAVGNQAPVRAGGRGLDLGLVHGQGGILAQDRGLELDELRSWIQSRFVDQDAAGSLQGLEGLCLAPGLVLRPCQHPPALFA
jgi:hypothetical protein